MKKNIYTETVKLLPFYLFFTILTWFVSNNIFFWDTVQLASAHAHYFFDTNFQNLLLPDNIDSGHIPAFGVYLAFIWKFFGKTLFISHFAMLPFIIGIIRQAYLLIKKFISEKYVFLALIMFLADATLLAQTTLISPDVVLVFLFLTALNSVLKKNNFLLSISVAGLFLISMRGMMAASSILVLDIIFNIKFENLKNTILQLLKKSLFYIPALFIFIIYNIYHYKVKGWVAYHEDSPWQSNFEITNLSGFIKNIGILIWRLLDFGKIFIWLAASAILLKFNKSIFKDKNIKQIGIIFIFTLLSLAVSFLLYKSLAAHRYILPVYLIFALFASYLIFEKIKPKKLKYIIFSIVLTGMLSGNFWIYPEKVAQGWDSSLTHLPYYKLRSEMLEYMRKNKISVNETASSFPNTAEFKYLDLSNDTTSFSEIDLDKNKYFFYSNIYNDLKDTEIDKLKNEFKLLKTYKSFGVFVSLYSK
ncbi:MAG: hypothetical protein L3J35_10130 [Bacteroidales bacterium]|nr:hypothetical protein [Bacteroidales bacterium]